MEYYRYSVVRKLWVLVVLLLSTFVGCRGSSTMSEMETEHQRLTSVIRHQISQIESDYISASKAEEVSLLQVSLEPGDEVEVIFYYTPELNITQLVRPDGKIALQLIGEIDVHGKTPADLRNELLERYAPHLKNPEVAVVMRTLRNRRVFVGGQVVIPGVIEMPGKTDVLEAVMQSGGFILPESEVKNVIVIRHKDGQRYAYSVNLGPALKGEPSKPFFLRPQDIVYVPRTKITMIGQWVDQHINRLIPETGFFFTRSYGRTAIGYDTD